MTTFVVAFEENNHLIFGGEKFLESRFEFTQFAPIVFGKQGSALDVGDR